MPKYQSCGAKGLNALTWFLSLITHEVKKNNHSCINQTNSESQVKHSITSDIMLIWNSKSIYYNVKWQWLFTFIFEGPHSAVDNTRVRFIEPTRLQHLPLILDQQFHSLNGGRSRLRDDGGGTAETKVLSKPKMRTWLRLFRHLLKVQKIWS